jgi:hypothetical protein
MEKHLKNRLLIVVFGEGKKRLGQYTEAKLPTK